MSRAVAKRQKTRRQCPEERDEKSDRPETPRAVPHGHAEISLVWHENSLEPFFLACARMTMLWDAMLLQDTFRELEGLETEEGKILPKENSLENVMEVGDVPAIIVQNRMT